MAEHGIQETWMETIEQLREMRDAARRRVEAMPDYKLMTKLSTLIAELEEMFGVAGETASGEDPAEEDSGEEEPEARSPRIEEPAPASAKSVEPEPDPAPQPANEIAPESWEPFEVAEAELEVETLHEAELVPEVEPIYEDEPVEYENVEELQAVADEDLLPEDEQPAATTVDTDIAISQAMAELEADLGAAELEPAPRNRFRYGNST